MAKIYESTKSSRGETHNCDKCHQPITTGQKFLYWKLSMNSPLHRRHAACGRPRPSELTSSKLSGVYAAVESAEDALNALGKEDTPADIAQILNDCAGEVESVKDEYQESLDNMPEPLQQGPTGQDMQEKIESLETFHNVLTDKASDLEGLEKDDDDEDQEDWFNGLVSEAQDTLGELSV